MFYVISYDIPNDRRRSQLAKVLKGFGTRVQYSVFEAHLNRRQYEELKCAVDRVIDSSADSVRYYVLCGACAGRISIVETNANPGTSCVELCRYDRADRIRHYTYRT